MPKIMIGVMGGGNSAPQEVVRDAKELGKLIAEKGWVVLSGGREAGVMGAVSAGAKEAGGLVVGILPFKEKSDAALSVDVAIVTGMGSARNNINVLSSDVVVACGPLSSGTLSEVALALKADRYVVLFNQDEETKKFITKVGGDKVVLANGVEGVIEEIQKLLA